MASLESDVMQSFALACDVIKDVVMHNVQTSAVRGDVAIDGENLKKLDKLVRASVDQACRNSARQLQSALMPYTKQLHAGHK